MTQTDLLIIGQGMAGTLLSYELMRKGISVFVMDKKNENNTSLVASAVIHPLVGKNWTVAKDAEHIIPIALETYKSIGEFLDADLVRQKSILIFYKDKLAATNFKQQKANGHPYLEVACAYQEAHWNAPLGVGEVSPVYTVDAQNLLDKWRAYLQTRNAYVEDVFQFEDLKIVNDKVQYKDIVADKIVFCEGAIGRYNPYFSALSFTHNRGDALLLSVPQLSSEHIYHKDFRLVPHRNNLFWCGSNYIWEYDSLAPNIEWRTHIEKELRTWLKLPFEIVNHWVAERPTTAGQQSYLLQNQEHKNVYFFNGLGTRGFSAGPSLAKEMSSFINK
ncbi:MAG: FAD-dependent oxidoreductase [Phycisphaerales bacterium]|nr:FAD-dependent oxidoreductase [Phycisphaerales bacterium]